MRELFQQAVSTPEVVAVWMAAVVVSLAWVVFDLRRANAHLPSLMKLVWVLTVAYAGPVGLALYVVTGRRQIPRDTLARRAGRSVAHCYSGCGLGEIVGVLLTVGVLRWSGWPVALTTFALAYVAGFGLTVGPLLQEGVDLSTALRDAFESETASITVMEVAAIGTDMYLAGSAGPGQLTFWGSLGFSLIVGLIAAYPVNLWLIHRGIKEGMHSPRPEDHVTA